MRLLRPLLVAAVLASLPASVLAEEFRTLAGHFDLPEGFQLLDRDESGSEDGKPSALYVFSRTADELPRAIYIVTLSQPATEGEAARKSLAEVAAIMADPSNPEPDAGKSKAVQLGGADGMRHQAQLPNSLQSITYVADHEGIRLLALLKHPKGREYVRDTARFEQALAGFTWTPVPAPEAPAEAPVAEPAGE